MRLQMKVEAFKKKKKKAAGNWLVRDGLFERKAEIKGGGASFCLTANGFDASIWTEVWRSESGGGGDGVKFK